MRIYYKDEKGNTMLDFNTLRQTLKVSKSKLYRMINESPKIEAVTYKNQFLYSEKLLYMLMKKRLIEKLNRNEYSKDKED